MVRGLVIGEHHFNSLFQQESPQDSLVICASPSGSETGAKFREDNGGQEDCLGCGDKPCRLLAAGTEFDVTVGIQSDPHFQRSSSTVS